MHPTFSFRHTTDLGVIGKRLTAHFGRIRFKDRDDPVSQFVGSFIASRTHDEQSDQAFAELVIRYPSWDALADAPVADIEVTLKRVTFPERKASGLKQALQLIRARFGWINLDFLSTYNVEQAMSCLQQIEGVGPKIAAATLNFSTLRMRAFVVDTHVLRFLKRFGFVGVRASNQVAYDTVMAAADDLNADDLFELQGRIKKLGQTVCTHAQALCGACPLSDMCLRRVEDLTVLKALLEKSGLEEKPAPTPLGHDEADLFLKGGLQQGVLHEVFSATGHETAATGFVAGLAARVTQKKYTLWIRQGFSAHEFGELSPAGLLELGLDPARMLLLSVPNASDGLRAANDALSCAALGTVVIEIPGSPKILDLTASRRLTLMAAEKSVTPFLLRLSAQPDASTAETRWLVRAAPSSRHQEDWGYPAFEVDLVRNRHGKTGHWFMEWNCDGRIFQSSTTHHGALVSAAAN